MPKAAALAGLALLAACTSTQSQVETGSAMLPRPQVVIVDTFAASPDEVQLDEGLSTEIEQAMKAQGARRAPSRSCRRVAKSPMRDPGDGPANCRCGSAVPQRQSARRFRSMR
jgi:hypothetical protein